VRLATSNGDEIPANNSGPAFSQLAPAIYETLTNFTTAASEDWTLREILEVSNRRLRQKIVQSGLPPPMGLVLLAPRPPVKITPDVVKRQMFKMLAFYVAAALHDANNTLTPVRLSMSKTKREWESLYKLADENKESLPPEPSARMMAYLTGIGEYVETIDHLVSQTTRMILDVQAFLHPSGREESSSEAVTHLFEENGRMMAISFTLMEILRGLVGVQQNINRLNEMAGEYGHYVDPAALRQGLAFLKVISKDVEAFQGLVTRIVDLFLSLRTLKEGMKNLTPSAMNLHDHLEERMLRDIAGTGIEVFFDKDPEPWPILAVSSFVWQMVVNPIVNARQAMQNVAGAQHLFVSTYKASLDPERAKNLAADRILPRARPGDYMVLRIEDTGPGIPTEILPRIFETGWSGKKQSGLGLAVLLNLAQDMDGFVTVETSTEESEGRSRGTTFFHLFSEGAGGC
jgi:signal transduction histidine kinase